MKRKQAQRRRARGTGSVYRDHVRGVWVAKKVVGRTAAGKLKYIQCTDVSQSEAIRKLAQRAGAVSGTSTVSEWAASWLAGDTSRARTREIRTNSVTKHINPVLGYLKLGAVTPTDVESAIRQWSQSLGVNSVRLVLGHLSTCFTAAQRAGLVERNPVKLARRPRGTRSKIDPFTAAELWSIITESAGRSTTRIFSAVAGTGCRIGEALGLDVGDFDPLAGTISITHTQARDRSRGPTKTETGTRTITVPAAVLPILRAAAAGRHSGPLFATVNGGRITQQNAQKYWSGLLARLGLPYRNVHQCRHSVATLQISAGVPPGDVARYLGDRVETIVKTYLHATGVNPANVMNKILGASVLSVAAASVA